MMDSSRNKKVSQDDLQNVSQTHGLTDVKHVVLYFIPTYVFLKRKCLIYNMSGYYRVTSLTGKLRKEKTNTIGKNID